MLEADKMFEVEPPGTNGQLEMRTKENCNPIWECNNHWINNNNKRNPITCEIIQWHTFAKSTTRRMHLLLLFWLHLNKSLPRMIHGYCYCYFFLSCNFGSFMWQRNEMNFHKFNSTTCAHAKTLVIIEELLSWGCRSWLKVRKLSSTLF